MFWTIIGALAFFFIVLPLIFEVLMQKWFWYVSGWLVLVFIAFVILPECSKDMSRKSYMEKQRVLEVQKAQIQQAEVQRQAEQARQYQAEQARQRQATWQEAAQAEQARELGRQYARKQQVLSRNAIREAGSGSREILLSYARRGKDSLKNYLKTLPDSEVQQLRRIILAEEMHYRSQVVSDAQTSELLLIQQASLQLDVEISTR